MGLKKKEVGNMTIMPASNLFIKCYLLDAPTLVNSKAMIPELVSSI